MRACWMRTPCGWGGGFVFVVRCGRGLERQFLRVVGSGTTQKGQAGCFFPHRPGQLKPPAGARSLSRDTTRVAAGSGRKRKGKKRRGNSGFRLTLVRVRFSTAPQWAEKGRKERKRQRHRRPRDCRPLTFHGSSAGAVEKKKRKKEKGAAACRFTQKG